MPRRTHGKQGEDKEFPAGFALKVLWWVALVVLVVWLLGFLVRSTNAGGRGRWYRW
ncbi:hydrophobic protein [Streptomyces murinus]|uniref:hydrophobic protein n=1 Tax=Streptomyces murinus TaxID=33900 RepID=UPI00381E750F